MQISSATQTNNLPQINNATAAKVRQAAKNLDSAMSSGNLADAKSALNQLNSAIPKTSDSANDPMKSKLETLTKAVNSGDVATAQSAYSDFKSSMPQRPSGPPPSDMSQSPDESQSGTSTSDRGLDVLA